MTAALHITESRRQALSRWADGLAAAVAASLPWSTSATGILIVLWLLVVLPVMDWRAVGRELQTAAGALPVVLFLLGVIGMAWAVDVPLSERLRAGQSFARLLMIPLLFVQFRNSPRGHHVLIAFFASCVVLLIASYVTALWPNLLPSRQPGVPAKNYIAQSAEFSVCIFAMLYLAGEASKRRDLRLFLLFGLTGLAFLFDLLFIVTSRTTLAILPALFLIWVFYQFKVRQAVMIVAALMIAGVAIWTSSSYLRDRVGGAMNEVRRYETENASTSAGERLEFWKKSIGFIADAPVLGHGVGSIRQQFTKAAVGTTGVSAIAASNPHNQTFMIAIQLGLVGAALLWAMWLSHLLLFRAPGVVSWFGLVVVLQHVGGSVFNSYLFDFTEGWMYVFGVGTLGGMMLGGTDRYFGAFGK